MPQIGPVELIIIVVILLLIFGANRLGEIGGALGKTVREFRHELKAEDTPPADKAAPVAKEEEHK